MSLPIIPNNSLDIVYLHKLQASNKMLKVLDGVDSILSKPLTKTASSDTISLVNAFMTILSSLNIQVDSTDKESISNLMSNLSKTGTSLSSEKQSSHKRNSERKDEIKIVSKSQKDSHYQIDVSKDLVVKNSKKLYMVSCYARDAYLGRYLIKRNFFYTSDREAAADDAYDEILTKISATKERYYSEIMDVSGIFTQIRQVLDGVVAEVKMEEDNVGTNINR